MILRSPILMVLGLFTVLSAAEAQTATWRIEGTVNDLGTPRGLWAGTQLGDPIVVTFEIDMSTPGTGGTSDQTYLGAVLSQSVSVAGISTSSNSAGSDMWIRNNWNLGNPSIPPDCIDAINLEVMPQLDYIHVDFIFSGGFCSSLLTSPEIPYEYNANELWFGLIVLNIGGGDDWVRAMVDTFEISVYEDNLCTGDGGNGMGCTNCPCMNEVPAGTPSGCANSSGRGSTLRAVGNPSVSLPAAASGDVRFELDHGPAGATAVLLSGDAVAPANMANPCFGLDSGTQAMDRDGLRCAVQGVRRHGNRQFSAAGTIQGVSGPQRVWGGPAEPAGGIAAHAGFVPGQTRVFQVVHREDPLLICMRGLNSSQAVLVTFTP